MNKTRRLSSTRLGGYRQQATADRDDNGQELIGDQRNEVQETRKLIRPRWYPDDDNHHTNQSDSVKRIAEESGNLLNGM